MAQIHPINRGIEPSPNHPTALHRSQQQAQGFFGAVMGREIRLTPSTEPEICGRCQHPIAGVPVTINDLVVGACCAHDALDDELFDSEVSPSSWAEIVRLRNLEAEEGFDAEDLESRIDSGELEPEPTPEPDLEGAPTSDYMHMMHGLDDSDLQGEFDRRGL